MGSLPSLLLALGEFSLPAGEQERLVPQVLRESAKATGDVVVFGKLTYLEVANHDLFRAKLEAEPLTVEDEAALANFGL